MTEQETTWVLTGAVGVLLFGQVAIRTRLGSLLATGARDWWGGVRLIGRHRWILVIFLVGHGAAWLVAEGGRLAYERHYATRLHLQRWPDEINAHSEFPWAHFARSARARALPTAAGWISELPLEWGGFWLAVLLLLRLRRSLLPRILQEGRFTPHTQRVLRGLLSVSAAALLVALASQFAWILLPRQPPAPLPWVFTVVYAGVIVAAIPFGAAVATWLTCGLVITLQSVAHGGAPTPAQLLEVNDTDFWRTIKWVALVTLVLSLPLALSPLAVQLAVMTIKTAQPGWIFTLNEGFSRGIWVLSIVLFPTTLFIVLEKSDWQLALRQTVGFWRRHLGSWLILLLPLLLLAFATNVAGSLLSWWAGSGVALRSVTRIFWYLTSAIVPAIWWMVAVRWWERQRPAVSNPDAPAAASK